MHQGSGVRAVVVVEGESDAAAVRAAAALRGRQLASDGVEVLAASGVTNFPKVLARLSTARPPVRVLGLYDEADEHHVRRGLSRTGLGSCLGRAEIADLGFYVCIADLEDELIRALGAAAVEQVLDRESELRSFRRFQIQPAQRKRSVDQQLRRFMGTRSRRKVRYGRLLVEALDAERMPAPLSRLISAV